MYLSKLVRMGVVVVCVALLVGIFMLLTMEDKELSGARQINSISNQSGEAVTNEEAPDPLVLDQVAASNNSLGESSELISSEISLRKLSEAYANAATALDANEIVKLADEAGFNIAQDWRVDLDQVCLLSAESASNSDAAEWHEDALTDYCSGYVISQDFSNIDEVDLFNYYDKRRQSELKSNLLEQMEGLDSNQISQLMNDFLGSANYPVDIEAAIGLISELYNETGSSVWDSFGLLDGQPVDSYRIQATALSLYSCYEFGGCGPNSITMLTNCSLTPVCEPHWSYEDLLRYGMSPMEFDLVLEIIRRLRNP